MIHRKLLSSIERALLDTPVVMLHGARQTGKTTLVRSLERDHGRRYVTLDDAGMLAAATSDPAGFLTGFDGPVTIDEVQRAPGLFLAIKAAVDRDRVPGRFLLTGSADLLAVPTLADSLAGRVEILTLGPLAQQEIEGGERTLVDRLFAAEAPRFAIGPRSGDDILARLVRSGFPEARQRLEDERRDAWFASYITTILERDAREIANIEDRSALPRLLTLLASRLSGLLNYSDLSRSLSIPGTTLKRYFALLEATFLASPVPAWSSNLGLRLSKSPKLFLCDSGLACHLMGAHEERLRRERTLLGPLLENFVASEIRKQATWSVTRSAIFHWRTSAGAEVDLLLEDRAGRLVGVEVKAGASVGTDDFKGLRALAAAVDGRLHRGVVLYLGSEVVPFGPNLAAVPIDVLWRGDE